MPLLTLQLLPQALPRLFFIQGYSRTTARLRFVVRARGGVELFRSSRPQNSFLNPRRVAASAKLDLRLDAIARHPGVEVSSRSVLNVPSVPVASRRPSTSGSIPPPPEVFWFFGLGPERCVLERQTSGVRTIASRHSLAILVGRSMYCHSRNDQFPPVNNRRGAPVNRPVNHLLIHFSPATYIAAGMSGGRCPVNRL